MLLFRTLASVLSTLALAGCAEMRMPRIDPSGNHLFICDSRPVPPPPVAACPPGTVPAPAPAAIPAAPVVQPVPVAQPGAAPPAVSPPVSPYVDAAVTLSPWSRVVPVGAEVVLVAGVRGGDHYLRTNRRLDWAILPGSVGQFTDIGKKHFEDFLVGDFVRPRIVSTVSAVGSTTRIAERVGQGGSVYVARGEDWIALRSPVEGVSRVTVVAPSVVVPTERSKSATIYWYDAQFCFPEPVVTPPGTKGLLTTSVWKLTSRSPLPGWIVRYELIGGPQAIFVPSGTTSVEVPTDAAGRASIEIVQKDPSPGTSQIRVQLFHPASQCTPQFLVRDGCTAVSWTDSKVPAVLPGPAPLPGPANSPSPAPTDRPAIIPPPVGGPPPAATAERPATAPAPVTTPSPAAVSVLGLKITPRSAAIVGANVTFGIEVTNRGATTAREVIVRDAYDPGLEPQTDEPIQDRQSNKPVAFRFGDLAPNETRQHSLTFRVTKTGRLCHRVEVLAADGGRITDESCVNAELPSETPRPAPTTPVPSVIPSPGTANVNPPPAVATMPVDIRVAAQANTAIVNQRVVFAATIRNLSQQPMVNATVVQQSDNMLALTQYLEGGKQRGAECIWNLPLIAAGQEAQLRVECTCREPTPKARCRFTVTLADGRTAAQEAAIEILPEPVPRAPIEPATPPAPPARLTVKVDNYNIATAGKNQQFLVRVTNEGEVVENDIVVTAMLPAGSLLVRADDATAGPDSSVSFQEQAGQVRFSPTAMAPKTAKVYRISVTTAHAGRITLQAEATGHRLAQAVRDSKSVDVEAE